MLMTNEEVRKIIPHRPPFMMVNEVIEAAPLEGIKATWYADPEWPIFEGHFPEQPVVPGVCSVECIAQAMSICILMSEKYSGKTPLFAAIDDVKFKSMIVPGDDVTITVEITDVNEERDLVSGNGEVWKGDTLCTKALPMQLM